MVGRLKQIYLQKFLYCTRACNNLQVDSQFNIPRRMSQYKIEAVTAQHIGNRLEQQDRTALFTSTRAPGYMMAVLADGMGGRSGGTIAAEQVIHTARQLFNVFSPVDEDVEHLLNTIAQETHTVVKLSRITSENEPHSTMVILVLTPEKTAIWAHIGDSRLYRFDGATYAERTIDHSFVEQLISEGKIKRAEARNHRLSNILVNVLGSSREDPFVTIGRCNDLSAGTAFLLCSDGLWPYFTHDELAKVIAAYPARKASELLIRKAGERAAGRGDNCTLAIVKLIPEPSILYRAISAKKLRQA